MGGVWGGQSPSQGHQRYPHPPRRSAAQLSVERRLLLLQFSLLPGDLGCERVQPRCFLRERSNLGDVAGGDGAENAVFVDELAGKSRNGDSRFPKCQGSIEILGDHDIGEERLQ